MPKSSNQKGKLYLIEHYLASHTDEDHGVSVKDLIEYLGTMDIKATRKTIYDDIRTLFDLGMDIVTDKSGREDRYKLVGREFELHELKLLADSVASARFISENKSHELVTKLGKLTSERNASQLRRDTILSGRVKTMDVRTTTTMYNVDKLHSALLEGNPIRFRYWQWSLDKEPELRHGGSFYHQLPHALLWEDENYYLITTDPAENKRKNFRVDKMRDIELLPSESWPKEFPRKLDDLPQYSNGMFGMYGGDMVNVQLECENGMIGIILDRFGRDTLIRTVDDGHFCAHVSVVPSDQFIGWVVAIGGGVRIVSPSAVVEKMQKTIARLAAQYGAE
ncbi:MAG: WYL domain-containing protein [Clostridia bacterium]|nr:WYL domain-containing protein [Clostridia bacterium]